MFFSYISLPDVIEEDVIRVVLYSGAPKDCFL